MYRNEGPSMAGQLGTFVMLAVIVVIAGPAFLAGAATAALIRAVPWMLTHPLNALASLLGIVVVIALFAAPVLGMVWIVKKRPQR
jgi:hypothetical protein